KAKGGKYTRDFFFGKYPELADMVKDMSDDEILRLNRGGHDPKKIYAAYHQAVNHKNQPTVILAKTVKGYGLGKVGEALNIAHNVKKLSKDDLIAFRDRFHIPIPDQDIESIPFFNPGKDSPEVKYMQKRRQNLGGAMP